MQGPGEEKKMGAARCREMGDRKSSWGMDWPHALMHVDAEAKDNCRVFGGC